MHLINFVFSDELSKLMSDIPTLDAIMKEIDQMATSGAKYSDAPHVIEVTLPMLCRYVTQAQGQLNRQ